MSLYNLYDMFPVGALKEQMDSKIFNNVAHEIIMVLGPDAWTRGPVKLFDKSIQLQGGKYVVTTSDGKIINSFPDKESAVKAALTINMITTAFGKSIREEEGKFVVYDGDKPIMSYPDRESAVLANARVEIGKIFKAVMVEWESYEPTADEVKEIEVYKASGEVNEDGTFTKGFKGCVDNMVAKGKSKETGEKMCSRIGRDAGKKKANDVESDGEVEKAIDKTITELNEIIATLQKGKASSAVVQPSGNKVPTNSTGAENTGGQIHAANPKADSAPPAQAQPAGTATPANSGYTGDTAPSGGHQGTVKQPSGGEAEKAPSSVAETGDMVPGGAGASAVKQPSGGVKIPAYGDQLSGGIGAWSNNVGKGLTVTKRDDGLYDWSIEYPIYKTDLEQRLVCGVVYEPDMIDAQGDSASEFEIQKAAHNFLAESKTLGVMHKEQAGPRAKIVESYVTPAPMRIGNQNVKKGTWIMTVKVTDDTLWDSVKTGKITGFSMGGRAHEDPMPV